jgi:monoamine oxidase
MFTARGRWADHQLTELGAELIDTGHDALRGLAEELGLRLVPILETPGSGICQDTWFFDGRRVSDAELVEAFRPVAVRLRADAGKEQDEAEFARIDELGLSAYLDSIADVDPVLRALLEVAYVGEYGREISEQSPWNLLWLIDAETPDPFRVYGDSDEAFRVQGGNDQVTTRLAARLASPIELEHCLLSVAEVPARLGISSAWGVATANAARSNPCRRLARAG